MPVYALRIHREDPERGTWWHEAEVELDAHRSVLDAILQLKDDDGTLAVRYSCRAAICGSCGVRVCGRPHLACNTPLGTAQGWAGDGPITVEPMGNMPVIKDLVVDMDAVHWRKVQRVTPWLQGEPPADGREHLVDHATMVDVTQVQACIHCGACVSNCMSLEVDPLFIGPAALAKAYRFVGDPRDTRDAERLRDLAQDPHGLYDCTHCFQCIDACPKGVEPMNQIMRLRRIAGTDHGIVDRNNGHRHEAGFVANVRRNGLLNEADLVRDSYGMTNPRLVPVLVESLPAITRALLRRKIGREAIGHPHRSRFKDLPGLFDEIEGREERVELRLYVSGREDD